MKQIAWHHKGDYFSTVAPEGDKNGVSIHQLSQQRTQYPFRRSKGQVQCAVFHPSKPIFFVASQRFIRVYDLLKQKLLTKVRFLLDLCWVVVAVVVTAAMVTDHYTHACSWSRRASG